MRYPRLAILTMLALTPVMAFIDISDTIVGVEIQQINARYIEPEQNVELTFKFMPGQILTGRVETVLQAMLAKPVDLERILEILQIQL